MRHFTHRGLQSGHFFSKFGHFFPIFEKGQGLLPPLSSYAPEVGAAQDTRSCMLPTLKISYHKWEGFLFISALLHNFTLVKVKKGMLYRVGFFRSCNNLFFSFKNVM